MITSETIDRSGVTSTAEALCLAPSLQVEKISSNKWAFSKRSFNAQFANKLLVIMDSRSFYTPTYSGVYWEDEDAVKSYLKFTDLDSSFAPQLGRQTNDDRQTFRVGFRMVATVPSNGYFRNVQPSILNTFETRQETTLPNPQNPFGPPVTVPSELAFDNELNAISEGIELMFDWQLSTTWQMQSAYYVDGAEGKHFRRR